MINPTKITNYERSDAELEELLLFCIAVAGKNAKNTAVALDKYLAVIHECPTVPHTPFSIVRGDVRFERDSIRWRLDVVLKSYGFGCYRARAKAFAAAASSGLDLRTCTLEALLALPGVGPKTARFFLLHSRRDFRGAVLDTHVLKYLRACGVAGVPKSTPAAGKAYARLEAELVKRCPPWLTLAEFDLEIWNHYAGGRGKETGKIPESAEPATVSN